MTGKKCEARDALDRLAEALVDDVLNTSDQEILAEFRETGGDPNKFADDMFTLFDRTMLAANKSKLAAAKVGAARAKAAAVNAPAPIGIAAARKQLRDILLTTQSEALTMAARKESELSDADVIGMLEDLRTLGIIEDGDTGGGNA